MRKKEGGKKGREKEKKEIYHESTFYLGEKLTARSNIIQ